MCVVFVTNKRLIMKLTNNMFYWVLIAATLTFILYQKGIIMVNFENVDPRQAFSFYHDNNTTLLDVRTKKELKTEGMIEGAIHIPLQELSKNIENLSAYKNSKILVYCRSGSRSISASRILSNAGFKVYNLRGGINAWKREKFPLH